MTEYLVLIVGDPQRWINGMSDEQRRQGYAEYERFGAELGAAGHRIVAAAELHPQARHIAPGAHLVSDGPYAETVEQVGGFYLVDTEDPDDLARRCAIIAALGDAVEIRRTVAPEERSR